MGSRDLFVGHCLSDNYILWGAETCLLVIVCQTAIYYGGPRPVCWSLFVRQLYMGSRDLFVGHCLSDNYIWGAETCLLVIVCQLYMGSRDLFVGHCLSDNYILWGAETCLLVIVCQTTIYYGEPRPVCWSLFVRQLYMGSRDLFVGHCLSDNYIWGAVTCLLVIVCQTATYGEP